MDITEAVPVRPLWLLRIVGWTFLSCGVVVAVGFRLGARPAFVSALSHCGVLYIGFGALALIVGVVSLGMMCASGVLALLTHLKSDA